MDKRTVLLTKGRPVGKRSSPEFTQVGLYIRKATKKAAELRLIQETGKRDLSDLIERLLTEWLATGPGKSITIVMPPTTSKHGTTIPGVVLEVSSRAGNDPVSAHELKNRRRKA